MPDKDSEAKKAAEAMRRENEEKVTGRNLQTHKIMGEKNNFLFLLNFLTRHAASQICIQFLNNKICQYFHNSQTVMFSAKISN